MFVTCCTSDQTLLWAPEIRPYVNDALTLKWFGCFLEYANLHPDLDCMGCPDIIPISLCAALLFQKHISLR